MKEIKIGEYITLINGDCMDYMQTLESNAFELAVVDPPYGIGEDGSTNKTRSKLAKAKNYKSFAGHDKQPPSALYFDILKTKSVNQIIWGANHFIQRIPASSSSCWLVWDKLTGASDFADCELAYTSFLTAVRKFTFKWAGMLQQDMKNKEHRIHPTQKPVALYKWILHNYAKEGDKILDTHLGSGSSAIAAHDMKHHFVGIELDTDYFNAAVKRIKQHVAQQTLF